jgi:hypothetical protein
LLQSALAESAVLSVIGGALGVLLAFASVRALLGLIPVTLPTWMRIEVDPAALAFAVLLTLLTALLCGLLSALFAARTDLNAMLKEDARTSTGGGRRLRGAFVVSQVSLTLLLLIGASLLAQTFIRLRNQDTGFASDRLIVVRATNYRTGSRQEQAAALSQFHEQVLERVRAVPGVIAAGGTNVLPYTRVSADRTRGAAADSRGSGGRYAPAAPALRRGRQSRISRDDGHTVAGGKAHRRARHDRVADGPAGQRACREGTVAGPRSDRAGSVLGR